VSLELDGGQQDRLLMNLRGLTLSDAERLLTRMIVEDGRLDADDLAAVVDAKRAVVEREGLLEYYSLEADMDDIADLGNLKEWLRQRRGIIAEPDRAKEFGLDFPRGILLVGVPGGGKSLCAKAVAADWHLPLLKLDPGSLYDKFIGESERNFRRALSTAVRVAPVVLWIDEIEKAFASGDADGGVSQRILGSFLSWMQERRGDVFIVATANDIARLPPEFLRKGRFDEIFFVDLPDADARADIFEVHLRKRAQPVRVIDTRRLAEATEGFSGAEIEQVVVAGLFTAFSGGESLSTDSLLQEAALTRPLSVTMAERLTALREWARGRTRMA
jgi:SpoVK/Ycf46/Vps4 family AAA+-type ATPase